jgi:hypothetical protein
MRFACPLCGQHIKDGKPCGCGARMLLAATLLAAGIADAAPIVWVKVTEPMAMTWSQVDDIGFVDRECRSDNYLPRVCIYRHLDRCRIITKAPRAQVPERTVQELVRMCGGYFPEPVLLRNRFSDPSYLPNQAPPSVDPAWKYQNDPANQ